MNIRDMIYHLLTVLQKCKVQEVVGIWYVTTPQGEKWDMTVPMKQEKKSPETAFTDLVREIGLRHVPEDLDDHVHELKSKEASDINNTSLEAQVSYLVEAAGEEWVREVFLPKEGD
jgi:hypothetical protein